MKTLMVADGPTHRMQELLKSYRLAQIAVDGQSGPGMSGEMEEDRAA